MKIERFEDIRAWQQARELANIVYDLTEQPKFSIIVCVTKFKALLAQLCTILLKVLMMALTTNLFIF